MHSLVDKANAKCFQLEIRFPYWPKYRKVLKEKKKSIRFKKEVNFLQKTSSMFAIQISINESKLDISIKKYVIGKMYTSRSSKRNIKK